MTERLSASTTLDYQLSFNDIDPEPWTGLAHPGALSQPYKLEWTIVNDERGVRLVRVILNSRLLQTEDTHTRRVVRRGVNTMVLAHPASSKDAVARDQDREYMSRVINSGTLPEIIRVQLDPDFEAPDDDPDNDVEYRVQWETDVPAYSARDAAESVFRNMFQQYDGNIANVFTVKNPDGTTERVDLMD